MLNNEVRVKVFIKCHVIDEETGDDTYEFVSQYDADHGFCLTKSETEAERFRERDITSVVCDLLQPMNGPWRVTGVEVCLAEEAA